MTIRYSKVQLSHTRILYTILDKKKRIYLKEKYDIDRYITCSTIYYINKKTGHSDFFFILDQPFVQRKMVGNSFNGRLFNRDFLYKYTRNSPMPARELRVLYHLATFFGAPTWRSHCFTKDQATTSTIPHVLPIRKEFLPNLKEYMKS